MQNTKEANVRMHEEHLFALAVVEAFICLGGLVPGGAAPITKTIRITSVLQTPSQSCQPLERKIERQLGRQGSEIKCEEFKNTIFSVLVLSLDVGSLSLQNVVSVIELADLIDFTRALPEVTPKLFQSKVMKYRRGRQHLKHIQHMLLSGVTHRFDL